MVGYWYNFGHKKAAYNKKYAALKLINDYIVGYGLSVRLWVIGCDGESQLGLSHQT